MIKYFIGITVILVLSSCFYDNEEDLYGVQDCSGEVISYNQTVVRILERFCYECHSNAVQFGGINMEGYENVQGFANEGFLLATVRHESGFPPMPPNITGMIPECDIFVLEQWVEDGALNN